MDLSVYIKVKACIYVALYVFVHMYLCMFRIEFTEDESIRTKFCTLNRQRPAEAIRCFPYKIIELFIDYIDSIDFSLLLIRDGENIPTEVIQYAEHEYVNQLA